MKILYALEPVDFRKGIDGLAVICRKFLKSDPLSLDHQVFFGSCIDGVAVESTDKTPGLVSTMPLTVIKGGRPPK
jgi:hypothetical protein